MLRVLVYKEYFGKFSAFFKEIVERLFKIPWLLENVTNCLNFFDYKNNRNGLDSVQICQNRLAKKHTNANMIRGHSHCVFLLLTACAKSLLNFRNVWMDWIDGTVSSWRLCMNALLPG